MLAELHCHTRYSSDSLVLPARLLEVCRRRGIDKVAITDHNTIEGALEAARLDPDRVIVGEEIKTLKGELIAYFVREEIPPGLEPEDAIERLRSQGAFISVSHPLDRMRSKAWSIDDLRGILPLVDALEVFNARNWCSRSNRRAACLAAEYGKLGTAGSDAHTYAEIGRATMRMPDFHNVDEFRHALATAHIAGRRSTHLVHLASRYATVRKSLGWRPPQ